MGGDSGVHALDGVAKAHNVFGEGGSVQSISHGLGSRLILLGRGTLGIGRGEDVSRGSCWRLLVGREAPIVGKTSCGLREHEL